MTPDRKSNGGPFLQATGVAMVVAVLGAPASGLAQPPVVRGDFVGLASDRRASQIGDSLTVIVLESSTASNSTRAQSSRNNRARAEVITDSQDGGSIQFGLQGGFTGLGESGRSDRMIANVGVVVSGILPNGDLWVSGHQRLQIGQDITNIRVEGRVRPADISPQNTVISSRLAQADIAYTGDGLSDQASRRGPVGRLFGWLGF